MADILPYRPRPRCPYDTIAIFPYGQLFATQPALDLLEAYGIEDPQGKVFPCVPGKLEDVAISDEPPESHAAFIIPAARTTHDIYRALRGVRDLRLQPLERLLLKSVYYVPRGAGDIGGHHIVFDGEAGAVLSLFAEWRAIGAAEVLASHMAVSARLATVLTGGRSVYTIFGVQTADNEFVIEATELEGPFACARWNGRFVVVPDR